MILTREELLEKFLSTIEARPHNTKRLFTVGLIGLNGSGKTTVARLLAKKTRLYIASNDVIRRFLNTQGWAGDHPDQELLQHIAEASSEFLYKNSISHIIDADLIKFHRIARPKAQQYGADFMLIHIICREEVILKRLEQRQTEISTDPTKDFSRAGKDMYEMRKKLHDEMPLPDDIFYTIDTSSTDTEQQISILIEKFKDKGLL